MAFSSAKDVLEFRRWSVHAMPGDSLEYYVGNLAMDISVAENSEAKGSKEKAAHMIEMRDTAWKMMRSGLVHLVQRILVRDRIRTFQYLAVRSQMGRRG